MAKGNAYQNQPLDEMDSEIPFWCNELAKAYGGVWVANPLWGKAQSVN
jgi:hypothetical protein